MDRHEQIGAHLARQHHTLAQTDVVIAGARQLALHAGLRIDQLLQPLGDLERDLLFLGAVFAACRPGIFAAVAGVDRDDDVASAADVLGRLGDTWLSGSAGIRRVQVDHQPVAVSIVWFEQERFRPHRLLEVEHHTQAAVRTGRVSHAVEVLVFDLVDRKIIRQRRIGEIDHQAVGVFEREYLVHRTAAGVEHQAGVVGCRPQAHAGHLRGKQRGGE